MPPGHTLLPQSAVFKLLLERDSIISMPSQELLLAKYLYIFLWSRSSEHTSKNLRYFDCSVRELCGIFNVGHKRLSVAKQCLESSNLLVLSRVQRKIGGQKVTRFYLRTELLLHFSGDKYESHNVKLIKKILLEEIALSKSSFYPIKIDFLTRFIMAMFLAKSDSLGFVYDFSFSKITSLTGLSVQKIRTQIKKLHKLNFFLDTIEGGLLPFGCGPLKSLYVLNLNIFTDVGENISLKKIKHRKKCKKYSVKYFIRTDLKVSRLMYQKVLLIKKSEASKNIAFELNITDQSNIARLCLDKKYSSLLDKHAWAYMSDFFSYRHNFLDEKFVGELSGFNEEEVILRLFSPIEASLYQFGLENRRNILFYVFRMCLLNMIRDVSSTLADFPEFRELVKSSANRDIEYHFIPQTDAEVIDICSALSEKRAPKRKRMGNRGPRPIEIK